MPTCFPEIDLDNLQKINCCSSIFVPVLLPSFLYEVILSVVILMLSEGGRQETSPSKSVSNVTAGVGALGIDRQLLPEVTAKMEAVITHLQKDLQNIRVGRVVPGMEPVIFIHFCPCDSRLLLYSNTTIVIDYQGCLMACMLNVMMAPLFSTQFRIFRVGVSIC